LDINLGSFIKPLNALWNNHDAICSGESGQDSRAWGPKWFSDEFALFFFDEDSYECAEPGHANDPLRAPSLDPWLRIWLSSKHLHDERLNEGGESKHG
jgi:hypothetical protein